MAPSAALAAVGGFFSLLPLKKRWMAAIEERVFGNGDGSSRGPVERRNLTERRTRGAHQKFDQKFEFTVPPPPNFVSTTSANNN